MRRGCPRYTRRGPPRNRRSWVKLALPAADVARADLDVPVAVGLVHGHGQLAAVRVGHVAVERLAGLLLDAARALHRLRWRAREVRADEALGAARLDGLAPDERRDHDDDHDEQDQAGDDDRDDPAGAEALLDRWRPVGIGRRPGRVLVRPAVAVPVAVAGSARVGVPARRLLGRDGHYAV